MMPDYVSFGRVDKSCPGYPPGKPTRATQQCPGTKFLDGTTEHKVVNSAPSPSCSPLCCPNAFSLSICTSTTIPLQQPWSALTHPTTSAVPAPLPEQLQAGAPLESAALALPELSVLAPGSPGSLTPWPLQRQPSRNSLAEPARPETVAHQLVAQVMLLPSGMAVKVVAEQGGAPSHPSGNTP